MIAQQNLKQTTNSVLVIDDEAAMRRVLKNYLEMYGFEVYEAEDGSEGFEILKTRNFTYVFIDHHMPKMDGAELLQKLIRAQLGGSASFILMTGGDFKTFLTSELQRFLKGFLNKPFSESDLNRILRKS